MSRLETGHHRLRPEAVLHVGCGDADDQAASASVASSWSRARTRSLHFAGEVGVHVRAAVNGAVRRTAVFAGSAMTAAGVRADVAAWTAIPACTRAIAASPTLLGDRAG
ncbi:hypothetical protein QMZ92_01120 [Streptomyces sp. HNM0645]|uniref:hypothetical protein n=1 Tax=Streptomyces sp. HNM0645 TaxID=2782343 RepID=UPI0024B6D4AB|nr:hypothetical protein [Streptomyces sp. HNM0645]MDI9883037.1 hypothetical protein [Streptomyces sp. HNM0645]